MKPLLIITLTASIVGTLFGAVMLYVGFQHNPQGEFFDQQSGAVDYWYSFLIFFSNFIGVFLIIIVLTLVVWLMSRLPPRSADNDP